MIELIHLQSFKSIAVVCIEEVENFLVLQATVEKAIIACNNTPPATHKNSALRGVSCFLGMWNNYNNKEYKCVNSEARYA